MKTTLLILGLLGLLTGCISPPAPNSSYLTVDSIPQGAQVSFPDGTECETPCPVIVSEPLEMTVAKAGYKAVRRNLQTGLTGDMTIVLELVAPTTEVEESDLPDL